MNEGKIIVNTAEDREKIFIALYKSTFPAVARYISKMGGTFDEAKDIFQDALVIYYERSVAGSCDIQINEKAYLMGIAKHLWLKKFGHDNRYVPIDGLDAESNEDIGISGHKLLNFLQTAGKKCMDLLRSFYYDQLPLTDIAEAFGFSGVRSATVQKYKCLEKVRETVKEKALTYEDFLD
ncbi:RNA polymerase sigma factor [Mucilaginibacter ginsenosidivorans]|uniref:Sigma-70 family RNA polymerase sigma factor n=1 Tax=Mucilaginibacter ginsenosidivorans TaxID=398053 RepID=A0A5B8UW99_9SPHI|nr:sigma-70 family RNA polymerase sigma factor [Mucilaginibacter ginsenosidivorans]QEC63189.1 sigma-70 family RNA polymerase sigma factor [Mucilaginibacter ginsenosidivorans]